MLKGFGSLLFLFGYLFLFRFGDFLFGRFQFGVFFVDFDSAIFFGRFLFGDCELAGKNIDSWNRDVSLAQLLIHKFPLYFFCFGGRNFLREVAQSGKMFWRDRAIAEKKFRFLES